MPVNKASNIRKVIASLKTQEKETLRQYLSSFHTKYGEYTPKTLQAFDLINDNTDSITDEELYIALCGDAPKDTYLKLMFRLKEKVFESLILDINLKRKGIYSDPWVKQQQIRKNLIIADLLTTRGLTEEALTLVNKSIKEGLKYELYTEMTQFLSYKFNILLRSKQFEQAEKVEKEYLKYSAYAEIQSKANYYFYTVTFGMDKKPDPEKLVTTLQEKIADLESYKDIQKVVIAYLYLVLMKIQLEEIRGNYMTIIELANESLALLARTPTIAKKARYANTYLQLYSASMHLSNYNEAFGYLAMAKNYINQNSKNLLETLEYSMYAMFYAERFEDCMDINKECYKLAKRLTGPDDPVFSKLDLEKAYIQFAMGNYQDCLLTLIQTRDTRKTSPSVNYCNRLLQIMAKIETKDYDSAENLIENFRKYLELLQKQKKTTRREHLIFRSLLNLYRNEFHFDPPDERQKKMLEQLSSTDLPVQWKYFTAELHPYHVWYLSKTKGAVKGQ